MTFDLAEMRLQLEKGADVDETLDEFGHTALYLACEHGRVDDELGADVDRRSADGATPLFISCRNGHLGAATLCLNRGGSRPCGGRRGDAVACLIGNANTARLCSERGGDVDRAVQSGRTPLYRRGADISRTRRGTPRLRRGYSAETRRGDAAVATPRSRRRGCDVENPWRPARASGTSPVWTDTSPACGCA